MGIKFFTIWVDDHNIKLFENGSQLLLCQFHAIFKIFQRSILDCQRSFETIHDSEQFCRKFLNSIFVCIGNIRLSTLTNIFGFCFSTQPSIMMLSRS